MVGVFFLISRQLPGGGKGVVRKDKGSEHPMESLLQGLQILARHDGTCL